MKAITLAIAIALTLLSSTAYEAFAQDSESERALAVVRPNDRAALTRLIKDYLRLEQSQQWREIFDLLSPTYIRGQSRDDFVRERQSFTAAGRTMVILDFALKHTYASDPFRGTYGFYGCSHVYNEGHTNLTNAIFDVTLEKDRWLISHVGVFVTCQPRELDCKE